MYRFITGGCLAPSVSPLFLSLPSSSSLHPSDSIHAIAMNRDTFFFFISLRRPCSFFSFLSDISRTHTRIRTRKKEKKRRERGEFFLKRKCASESQYGSKELSVPLCACLGRRMNQRLLFLSLGKMQLLSSRAPPPPPCVWERRKIVGTLKGGGVFSSTNGEATNQNRIIIGVLQHAL